MNELVSRMRGFGTTIFAEMSALAARTGAINLGQGAPDSDGPTEVLTAAAKAMAEGHNQYPPGRGIEDLRTAIAEHQQNWYGLTYDPQTEVVVTAGATEGVAAALLALCHPGDEVLVLEPTYDSYGAAIALAGGVMVPVRLDHPDYWLDLDRLRAAVTPRTRLMLINSPHNPSGRVLTPDELGGIAEVAIEHDLVVICDEVYEHLTFDGHQHSPLATLPGMRERTITLSSGGKTFSTTGWKIGWACTTPELATAVNTTKQFLTFTVGGPLQYGIAAGLRLGRDRMLALGTELQDRRDQLLTGLRTAGIAVEPSNGTYFLTGDISSIGETDSISFCLDLPRRCGLVAIPSQAFYLDPRGVETLVRFTFCKTEQTLTEANRRLATLSRTSVR
ncbi:pyridoxal phosphate-dependent aminotransferase [Propionibacteriaceae bacterium Y1685]